MYRDRKEAGISLAGLLEHYRGQDVLVLALPRGGVEVGYEIAETLDAELDVLVVRKLGAPGNPELGVGAIASYGGRYLDESAIATLEISPQTIARIESIELLELRRREATYRNAFQPPRIRGRVVIIVDDGVATGGSARAAIRAVANLGPSRIVLAIPVAPPDTLLQLQDEVDELVCPLSPAVFQAVGQWYEHFDQTTDERVLELLRLHRRRSADTR